MTEYRLLAPQECVKDVVAHHQWLDNQSTGHPVRWRNLRILPAHELRRNDPCIEVDDEANCFANQDLSGAIIVSCDLQGMNWFGVLGRNCVFHANRFTRGIFNHARFGGTDFYQSHLDHIFAQSLQLQQCDLRETDWSAAHVRGAEWAVVDLSYARLDGADLSRSALRKIEAVECSAVGANFWASDIVYSTWHGSNLSRAVFRGANLYQVDFQGADCSYADFRGAILQKVDFRRCTLTGADFRGADLSEAYLEGVDLTQTIFAGAVLPNDN